MVARATDQREELLSVLRAVSVMERGWASGSAQFFPFLDELGEGVLDTLPHGQPMFYQMLLDGSFSFS